MAENLVSVTIAKKIHLRLLLIMKELHRICVDNNITYYVYYGTALGAKRHKGFIPWDDDVDIGMPRPDYEKFCALADNCFPDFIERRYFKTVKNSPFHFVKLIDNRTTLIEQNYKNYLEGLYIDVFPIDGVGKYNILDKIKCRYIWNVHRMIIYRCSTEKKNSLIKNIIASICRKMDLNKLHNILEKALISTSYESSEYVTNYLGGLKTNDIVPRHVLGKPQLMTFEDAELYAPEKINEYLTKLYGDYMELPPENQRVFKHNYYVLNFDIPYREYMINGKDTDEK